jgi:hypothetical protein
MDRDRGLQPLVVLGLGGAASEMFASQSARLAPLTDADADKLIRSVLVLVLSDVDGHSAADLPEVTYLDLSPAVVRAGGVTVTGARITMTPPRRPRTRSCGNCADHAETNR